MGKAGEAATQGDDSRRIPSLKGKEGLGLLPGFQSRESGGGS